MSALGLGGYDSSDDDADEPVAEQPKLQTTNQITQAQPPQTGDATRSGSTSVQPEAPRATNTFTQHAQAADIHSSGVAAALGPSLPPESFASQSPPADLPEVDPSLSPFSQSRQQVRMLTMPPVPNFEIPPSPPPADPSTTAVANKKIRHFLDLKRQGVHFNQRLLSSNALRNPGMASKLMDFAGIEGVIQYDHALAEGLGVDVRHWAGLRVEQIVSQMEDTRRREANGRKGKPREFVSEGGTRGR
ncbi:hypothetical protein K461DRAFT_4228 [Myriangium duriaei CBS 260.36]|uniref:HCNGP-like protein n=1 Tax=Myriangium duriaei CBS 260.36 TaxID=1168546 RepID=A0A9P4J7H8_9PEZI|nr:hypothetical protein K461DRAFT_4228 [Myriangium duriaei CBS 260.36]